MTSILYKYRSLENFKYFVDIILKNRLYAGSFKELNDPMEGHYYYHDGELNHDIRDKLTSEKESLRICSLSRINNNELMWSHYANGHRGVAIGVIINNEEFDVRPIQYNGLPFINNTNYNNQTAKEILSHKLEAWSYEKEERVFVASKHYIDAQITEIITGIKMSSSDFSFVKELVDKINPGIRIIKASSIMR